ncbi:MAG: DNA repair protein RecO [Myxococcota bacterium]|jgi:DNA repair protein RecO (recombination protein O)|nr:DNA repair protein RecO [Deltaproteobacteria bacterium]MCP4244127.1 DNA repair protein RecO [bacterium]MDP6076238.1 DNA repair protein RecO [Myxococcota bacterium]MDP6244130.1 DNA repair protein RecO [Myxococcota bacterium]MDP7074944.1 DNA repair protein RecO [Myxococcota bacterium]
MKSTPTPALVLRAVDFGESDRILHLLLPDAGRVTAIAKGARRSRRRFSGALDLFQYLKVQIDRRRRGAMARLDQAVLLHNFGALRVDPSRFALGCYLLELLDRLAPEGGARADTRRLFGFALASLELISERPVDGCLRTLLELRALDALGLRPEFSRCVRCGRPAVAAGAAALFHVADGGTVCASCTREGDGCLRVHAGTLRALEQGMRFDLSQLHRLVLPQELLSEARLLIGRFERFHVGVELRSRRFLEQRVPIAPPAAHRGAPREKPIYSPPPRPPGQESR